MKKYLKAFALLAWMALIFCMSAQPAVESEYTSNVVAELIYKLFAAFFGGMDLQEFLSLYIQPIRKLAHFTEFMILGMLVYSNFREYFGKKAFIYSLLFSFVYACSDEFHQLFVENRYCSPLDVTIDSCGATLGIILYHLVFTRWKKD